MRFSEFAGFLERIEAEPSRNAMVGILSEMLSRLESRDARAAAYLLQGVVEPPFKGIEFGLGEKMLVRAIALAYGRSEKQVAAEYRKLGDAGLVAEKLVRTGKQGSLVEPEPLGLAEVYSILRSLAESSGSGSQAGKVKAMAGLLGRASTPAEAKHLARIPLSKLRLGMGDPTILDALSVRFSESKDKSLRARIEGAYNLCSDMGLIFEKLYSGGLASLESIEISPGSPIRPALAERLNSGGEIIDKIGRCVVEAKYDGFRAQVHKAGGKIEMFSRSLERTTDMFPDIVEAVRKIPAREIIFEGEAMAIDPKTGRFLPFQETIQRKRKHGVKAASAQLPLTLLAFDILLLDGEKVFERPYSERRALIEKLFGAGGRIVPSEAAEARSAEDIDSFFEDAVSRGLEGIIAKKLDSPYVAGARKFSWIKLKKSYTAAGLADTLDLAVIGYFRGKGQRASFGFGGILAAVLDEEDGKLKSIAKVGSGFSEEQMAGFSKTLSRETVPSKPKDVESGIVPDSWVKPVHVVTVSADEITLSPTHSADGFALRFPRLKGGMRDDKTVDQVTTVAEIRRLYELQEGKRGKK